MISKRVKAGDLFFAISGTNRNGRDYLDEAIVAGAVAVITCRTPLEKPIITVTNDANIPVLQCDNPRQTMALMAARYWPSQPTMVAAVTGTNGKTSTTDFLRQLWQRAIPGRQLQLARLALPAPI